ncbi:MAG: DUF975 family protein [Pedosphaera sp.]|nr:DUF975 family protein [Pedosphaera sp.]
MYKIIGGDGNEYGPIALEQIQQWIAQGRANGQTQVQKDSGTFQPLANYPELAALLPGASGATGAPPVQGFKTVSGFRPIGSGSAGSAAGEVPLPADVLTRDFDLNIGDCLSRGWDLLKANFGVAVGVVLLYGFIIIVISLLGMIPCIGIVFSLASMLVGGPLMGGLLYFFIKSSRRQQAGVEDLFSGFKRNFIHLVLAQIVQGILVFVAILPGIVLTVVTLFAMGVRFENGVKPSPEAVLAGAAVLLVTVFVPIIYLSVRWAFTLPLVVDRKMDFWQAMVTSWKVVGKHWWKTFAFVFVASLINIAGLFCFCLGGLVTVPWMLFTYASAYEEVFGPRSASTPSTHAPNA